jgi:hypothetical protein
MFGSLDWKGLGDCTTTARPRADCEHLVHYTMYSTGLLKKPVTKRLVLISYVPLTQHLGPPSCFITQIHTQNPNAISNCPK